MKYHYLSTNFYKSLIINNHFYPCGFLILMLLISGGAGVLIVRHSAKTNDSIILFHILVILHNS